jgi:hypothetical protein
MAPVRSSETLVNVYRTTRRHTPEDSTLYIHYFENHSSVYTHFVIPGHYFHTGKPVHHNYREVASQKVKVLPEAEGKI